MSMVMGYTCYLCDVISKIPKKRDDEEVLLCQMNSSDESRDSSLPTKMRSKCFRKNQRISADRFSGSKNLISITPLTISKLRFSQGNSSMQSETWNL